MSALSAIVAALQADETLAGLLPGGIYDRLSVADVSRQATPDAFDEYQELLPCAGEGGECDAMGAAAGRRAAVCDGVAV